jgi:hypothetical protein
MILRQIELIKPENDNKFNLPFRLLSFSTIEMFWFKLYMLKVKTKNINKLIIYTDKTKNYNINGIKEFTYPFDFKNFDNSSRNDKKKLILDTVHNVLLSIADEQDIDKDKLQEAYKYCIDNNLENKWTLGGKAKSSPSKNYYGAVECLWEMEFMQATAIIYDSNKNEKFRKQLFNLNFEKPTGNPNYIYQYKPEWEVDEKNKEFLVFDIGNIFMKEQVIEKKWIIDPENEEIEVVKKQ